MCSRLALLLVAVGLLVVGSPVLAQQLIYDINPELGHLEAYGYQQQVAEPTQPLIASPVVPPAVPGGGAGSGAAYSGGMSTFGGGGASPAQQFLIYNPMAVAGMRGVTGRAEQRVSWPPRGGPWGVGPVPTATDTSDTELPDTLIPPVPTPEGQELEQGEAGAPTTGLAPPVPPAAGGAVDDFVQAVQPPASPLDQYLPPALLHTQYEPASVRSAARPSRTSATSALEERGTGELSSIYRQQTKPAPSTGEPLPAPDAARTTDTQRGRQLDPIYRQQAARGDDAS